MQLIFPSPVQKFPAFYGTRSFRSSRLVRIMSQMNPVRNIALFFFKTHFNIILSFMAAVFQAALSCPSGLHIGALSISLLPHARHISCPSHHPWFDGCRIWWGVITVKCLIMQFFQARSQNCGKRLSASSCLAVRPCVRMVQHDSHWTNFHEVWYSSVFRKSVEKTQVPLESDKNNGCFTWRPLYVFKHISFSSS